MTITCSYCSNFMLRSKRLQHSGQMQPFCRHLKWKKNCLMHCKMLFPIHVVLFPNGCMFYMTYRTPTAIVVIWSCLMTMMDGLNSEEVLFADCTSKIRGWSRWKQRTLVAPLQRSSVANGMNSSVPSVPKEPPTNIFLASLYDDKTSLNNLLQWRKIKDIRIWCVPMIASNPHFILLLR